MSSARNQTAQITMVAPGTEENPVGDFAAGSPPAAGPVLAAKFTANPSAVAVEPPVLARRGLTRAPASFAQRRLWFVCQYDPQSPLYNLPLALRLKGKLVLRSLQQAFDALIGRHEALRTRFISEDGEPVQVIDAPTPLAMRIVDLRAHEASKREEKLREIVATHSHEPFDLSRDRLLRVVVVRVAEDDHLLLVVVHHIVADGWSWQVLTKELALHYKAFITEWATALPELPIQYTDYTVWQQEALNGPHFERLLGYWRRQLAGAPQFIELPTDRPRPPVQSFRGSTVILNLSPTLTEGLRQVGQREGATLFMTLHAALQVLLGRYSRQEDFIIGAPIAGRTRAQLENLIGFFVNMLPLRADLSGNPTFRELLRRVRATAVEAYAHDDVPFERIVEELRPERQAGRQPLVQVAFVLQNMPGRDARFPGITASSVEVWTETSKLDLTLLVTETAQGLIATLEYNADLYDRATAVRLLGHWKVLLEAVVADPTQHITALPLLTPPERRQLLVDWNNTARPFPRDETIPRLVQLQAERTPDQVALQGTTGRLTYRELEGLANQLARRLQRLGVAPDAPVAVCLERSPEMIVAWLAVLKAGGAYVPIDPDYPPERRAFMLADTQTTIVVTSSKLRALFDGPGKIARVTLLCVDTDWADIASEDTSAPACHATAQNLAYLCYTSGSTGHPKGVCVPHRAVLRLLLSTDYFRLEAGDVVAQLSCASFDAATFEVWGALFYGAKLVIVPTDVLLSPRDLAAMLKRERVNTLFMTTGAFNTLSREKPDIFRTMKAVLTGGEAASPACFADVLLRGAPERLLNVYGPTECTTFATCQPVKEVAPEATSIPIGRPIANTTAYVLDERRQLVPVGIPGELYLGGDGVARGYHRRPELTAEKFIGDPFANRPGARLYRTGDMVRWLADGTLEFIGRVDNQIKLRGFRVELGEVETALMRYEGVREAAVVVQKENDDAQLVAHVVPKSGVALTGGQLREFLQRSMPAFMLPSFVHVRDTLPLTRAGKVDRAALPAKTVESAPVPAPLAQGDPRTRLERELLAQFRSVLHKSGLGIHDGFFEFGGHSLLAVRLVAQIERTLSRTVPVSAIFQAQTVAKLAAWLDVAKRGDPGDAFLTLQSQGEQPPLFLVHGVGGGMIWGYANLARRLGVDMPVYVLRSRGLEGSDEPETITGLAANYVAALREFQPEGPYNLGGYCFGGNVAYEMAVQLRQQGQEVRLLALLNSSPPNSSYDNVQLTPVGIARFVANLRHVFAHVMEWEPARRRQFFKWKLRTSQRRLTQLFSRMTGGSNVDVESMVDLAQYSEFERRVWTAHVKALMTHQHSRYDGPVTLFRSRGHCLVSSCDHYFGWNDCAPGNVRVVIVAGAHESILEEPHVETLAGEIAAAVQLARTDDNVPTQKP